MSLKTNSFEWTVPSFGLQSSPCIDDIVGDHCFIFFNAASDSSLTHLNKRRAPAMKDRRARGCLSSPEIRDKDEYEYLGML